MDDLITWLPAQLDDDERMLRALDETALNGIESTAGWDVREYVERGLAKVDATRRILDLYAEHAEYDDAENSYEHATGRIVGLGEAVRLLALPYADRPGYREEWRP